MSLAKSRIPLKPAGITMVVLEWIYDNVTSGSIELAESYRLKCAGDCEQGITCLIRSHVRYAAIVGFATNVGGVLNTPITAPLNISSVIAIQLRMIAAIAHLRGYSLHDRKVKFLVFICLTGSSAAALLQELGFGVGKRLGARLAAHGTRITVGRFNLVLGRRVLTNYGARNGVGRAAPLLGGLVGGVIDAGVTRGIGTTAKVIFKAVEQRAHP